MIFPNIILFYLHISFVFTMHALNNVYYRVHLHLNSPPNSPLVSNYWVKECPWRTFYKQPLWILICSLHTHTVVLF